MGWMFCECSRISDLSPLKDWDVSNVRQMDCMFSDCTNLGDLSCLDNWDVSNVEDMENIFENCDSITRYPKWYEMSR